MSCFPRLNVRDVDVNEANLTTWWDLVVGKFTSPTLTDGTVLQLLPSLLGNRGDVTGWCCVCLKTGEERTSEDL